MNHPMNMNRIASSMTAMVLMTIGTAVAGPRNDGTLSERQNDYSVENMMARLSVSEENH